MSSDISVVVPTYQRPEQIEPLLATFAEQTIRPAEIVIVDGASPDDSRTEVIVQQIAAGYPIPIRYIRSERRGTSVQRNVGIENAVHEFVALIDDDIRLEPAYFEQIQAVFNADIEKRIGGVCGYIDNQYFDQRTSPRWRLHRGLRLFSTYEPGRYDRKTGYPINTYTQPPFEGVREVDFLSGGYTVWRRGVFDGALQFAPFLGTGPLEDVHLSLRVAAVGWRLLQCGSARCQHIHAPSGRPNHWQAGYKKVINYWYTYRTTVPERSLINNIRFWYVQLVWASLLVIQGIRHADRGSLAELAGRLHGALDAFRLQID